MKKYCLFFVIAVVSVFGWGCSSTPKVAATLPVYHLASTNATTESPYQFSQEPQKRYLENGGREFKRHVRRMQRMRLGHERNLADIEQRGEEELLARERGVATPATTVGDTSGMYPVPNTPTTATFGYYPNNGYGYMGGGYGHGASIGGYYGTTGRLFGKTFRQSTLGYRHTGGPAIQSWGYSVQGNGVAVGTAVSGLGWGYHPPR